MEPMPTYHVDIWTTPISYVCTLCLSPQRYTLEDVTTHLREVHNADAIPTPNMEALIQVRTDSDQRAAEAAATAPQAGTPTPPPAPGPDEQTPAPQEPAAPTETPAAPPGETAAEESPSHA